MSPVLFRLSYSAMKKTPAMPAVRVRWTAVLVRG